MDIVTFSILFVFSCIGFLSFVVVVSLLFRKYPEQMKMAAVFLLVTALFIVVAFSPWGSRAESIDTVTIELEDYVVKPVWFDGEVLLCIEFYYEGELLAFYWEGELDTSCTLFVTLWGTECIDAGYIGGC